MKISKTTTILISFIFLMILSQSLNTNALPYSSIAKLDGTIQYDTSRGDSHIKVNNTNQLQLEMYDYDFILPTPLVLTVNEPMAYRSNSIYQMSFNFEQLIKNEATLITNTYYYYINFNSGNFYKTVSVDTYIFKENGYLKLTYRAVVQYLYGSSVIENRTYITNLCPINSTDVKYIHINIYQYVGFIPSLSDQLLNCLNNVYVELKNGSIPMSSRYYAFTYVAYSEYVSYVSGQNFGCYGHLTFSSDLINSKYQYASLKYLRVVKSLEPYLCTNFPSLGFASTILSRELIEVEQIDYTPSNDSTFWLYTSYKIEQDFDETITIEGFSYKFTYIKGISYQAYFFYDETTVENEALGVWVFNVGGIEWDLNFIRNSIVYLLNLMIFVFQALMYLLTLTINILVLYLLYMYIIPFSYNTIIYFLFYALVYVLVYLVIALKLIINLVIDTLEWIWEQIVILWNDYIMPFFEFLINDVLVPFFTDLWNDYIMPFFIDLWKNYIVPFFEGLTQISITFLVETLLPWLVDLFIGVISWIEALVIYLFSMGTTDLISLVELVKTFNYTVANFFTSILTTFTKHFLTFLLYSGMYLLLVGFLQIKIIYCKSKGYVNRTNELEQSMNAYAYPIRIGYNIISSLWNLIAVW